jgi:hypothetical protein
VVCDLGVFLPVVPLPCVGSTQFRFSILVLGSCG